MADAKTSALPAVVSVTAAQEFPVNDGGVSKRATALQIKAYAGVAGLATADAGTAIADNKALRGDGTTGIQGSLVGISDSGVVTADGLLIYPGGNQSADEKVQVGAATILIASDIPIKFYNDPDISSGSPDVGLERSAAGTLEVTNGSTGQGALAAAQLDVDNLRVDGNTLSSTNANGNVNLDPAGTGRVTFGGQTSSDPAFHILTFAGAPALRAVNGDFSGGAGLIGNCLAAPNDTTPKLYGDSGGLKLASDTPLTASATTNAQSGTGDVGMKRDAAGVWLDTDAGSGLGKRLTGRPVEANTAVAASPNLLASTESRKILHNTGATAENPHVLPTSAPIGYEQWFSCQDTDGIKITAPAGETISLGPGLVSAAGGFVKSVVVDSVVGLVKLTSTKYIVLAPPGGTWTIDV